MRLGGEAMRYLAYIAMMIVMAAGMLFSPAVASADDDKEMVYGSDLMTDQERREERQKMRMMTEEEREQYRAEKHKRMKERATEQDKAIPDEPGERGKGLNQGMRQGQGQGMRQGQGQGMRQGKGMGMGGGNR